MNQDQRAALERLLEYVGRGFCAVQADCKVLREFLKRTREPADVATVGDIVQMIGSNYGVSVGTSPNGRPYVSVMMDRIDTPDGSIYDPAVYVDNQHSDMTLDVVAAKVAARAARIHKGRKRTTAAAMKAPAKKAKAK